MSGAVITAASAADALRWQTMRHDLWPDATPEEHRADIEAFFADPGHTITLIAHLPDGSAAGFAEAGLRSDYVNGCDTSPVGFLEGLYVVPAHRRRGIAAQLVHAVADWARAQGCTEFASDATLDNVQSHAMHRALGFVETERVVYFRKPL